MNNDEISCRISWKMGEIKNKKKNYLISKKFPIRFMECLMWSYIMMTIGELFIPANRNNHLRVEIPHGHRFMGEGKKSEIPPPSTTKKKKNPPKKPQNIYGRNCHHRKG